MITPARGKLTWANLSSALVLAFRVMLHIGILSDYRKPFWRAARHALRRGQIDAVLGMGFIAHHLIQFTREALRGEQNASYYSTKLRRPNPRLRPNWRPRAQVGVTRKIRLGHRAGGHARTRYRPAANCLIPASARAWSTTARGRRRP